MKHAKTWLVQVKTISEANSSEHWSKKRKRHKMQQRIIYFTLKQEIQNISLPCHIKLTRISTRILDYDNLVSSQKFILDAICDLLIPGLQAGRADGDKRISTSYYQEKGKPQGIKVEISSL